MVLGKTNVPLNLFTLDDGGFKKMFFKLGCHWWWQRRKDDDTKLLAVKQQVFQHLRTFIAPRLFPQRLLSLWIVYFMDSKSKHWRVSSCPDTFLLQKLAPIHQLVSDWKVKSWSCLAQHILGHVPGNIFLYVALIFISILHTIYCDNGLQKENRHPRDLLHRIGTSKSSQDQQCLYCLYCCLGQADDVPMTSKQQPSNAITLKIPNKNTVNTFHQTLYIFKFSLHKYKFQF